MSYLIGVEMHRQHGPPALCMLSAHRTSCMPSCIQFWGCGWSMRHAAVFSASVRPVQSTLLPQLRGHRLSQPGTLILP